MNEISLAPQYLPLVRNGTKTTTIRRGHRKFPLGATTIKSSTGDEPVFVTDVRHVRLSDITHEDAKADGFESLADLRDALTSFYSGLRYDEPMTIVRFWRE